ncbi:hypothetical protein X975_08785, partial [Stegodyphus mimosarum]
MSFDSSLPNNAKPEIMAGSDNAVTVVHVQMDTTPPELSTIDTTLTTEPKLDISSKNNDPDPENLILEIRQLYQLKARFTDLEQTLSRAKRATPLASFDLKHIQQESQVILTSLTTFAKRLNLPLFSIPPTEEECIAKLIHVLNGDSQNQVKTNQSNLNNQ